VALLPQAKRKKPDRGKISSSPWRENHHLLRKRKGKRGRNQKLMVERLRAFFIEPKAVQNARRQADQKAARNILHTSKRSASVSVCWQSNFFILIPCGML
jgi:hypothetical protein